MHSILGILGLGVATGRHTARVAHLFAVSEAVGVGVGQAQVA
jgi:hypothetical protein